MSDPQSNPYLQIKDAFLAELRTASSGSKTSLPFITHSLSQGSLLTPGELCQVLVIGGSFFEHATLENLDGELKLHANRKGILPVFGTREDLCVFVDKETDPSIRTIAINFAYPLTPVSRDGRLDGILQAGSKEHAFTGMIGEHVGLSLEQYLLTKRKVQHTIAIANDTICLLMSGLTRHPWSELAAGIIGTGFNIAMFDGAHTAVNLESGSFDKYTPSEAAQYVDLHSNAPGEAIYEKEISGAYLYKLFNYEAQKRHIPIDPIGTSQQIDFLMSAPTEEISGLAHEIMQRSASLVAAQIAAILEYQQHDLTFIMQGSIFWKSTNYKETIEAVTKSLCPQYTVTFEKILQSEIYGAAKLCV